MSKKSKISKKAKEFIRPKRINKDIVNTILYTKDPILYSKP